METLIEHSIREWRRTPEMRIQDAYKWLFHATLGGEHAVTDESFVRAWLEQEWDEIGAPIEGEEEIQRLTPSGDLVRVNLRPYKARGGDRDAMLNAFICSAHEFRGDRADFLAEWHSLGSILRSGETQKLTYSAWETLNEEMQLHGYPTVHHSPEYENVYQPAYRVLLRRLWPFTGS